MNGNCPERNSFSVWKSHETFKFAADSQHSASFGRIDWSTEPLWQSALSCMAGNNKTMVLRAKPLQFVGNRLSSSLDLVGPDQKTLRQKYAIGDPQGCAAGTAEEMKRRGYLGLYKESPVTVLRLPNSNLTIRLGG